MSRRQLRQTKQRSTRRRSSANALDRSKAQ